MEIVFNYFRPKTAFSEDEDSAIRKHRLYLSFAILTCIILTIFSIAHVISGRTLTATIDIVGAIIILASAYIYKLKNLYALSVNIYTLTVCALVSLQHHIAPPGLQTNLLWIPILIFISFFLQKTAHAVAVVSATVLISIASEAAPRLILIKGDYFSEGEILFTNILTIFLSCITAYVIGKQITHVEKRSFDRANNRSKELFNLNETNTALLSILSHDLANKITISTLHSLKLSKLELSNDAKKSLKKINDSINNMKEIIEEVRTLKAGQSGKLKIELRSIPIADAVDQTIQNFADQMESKKIQVHVYTNFNEQPSIIAEPVSLVHSVFSNILSNAIKFSYPNSSIEVKLTSTQDNVIASFKDYGMGIPQEIQQNIFNQQAYTNRPGTNGEKGTGFGMPIVKMYMDRYNGKISLKSSSKEERGTEFSLYFQKA